MRFLDHDPDHRHSLADDGPLADCWNDDCLRAAGLDYRVLDRVDLGDARAVVAFSAPDGVGFGVLGDALTVHGYFGGDRDVAGRLAVDAARRLAAGIRFDAGRTGR